jgi:hypothetical protein
MKRGRRKRDQTKEHCNGRVNGDCEPGRGNKGPPPLRTRERRATEGVLASWSPCSRWPTATRPPDERAEEHYLDNDGDGHAQVDEQDWPDVGCRQPHRNASNNCSCNDRRPR